MESHAPHLSQLLFVYFKIYLIHEPKQIAHSSLSII